MGIKVNCFCCCRNQLHNINPTCFYQLSSESAQTAHDEITTDHHICRVYHQVIISNWMLNWIEQKQSRVNPVTLIQDQWSPSSVTMLISTTINIIISTHIYITTMQICQVRWSHIRWILDSSLAMNGDRGKIEGGGEHPIQSVVKYNTPREIQ